MLSFQFSNAQLIEPIPFGDFENWLNRDIKESGLLGGKEKRIFAIAPNNTLKGAIPYKMGDSPWSTSNAMAIIAGITKASNTTKPEFRSENNRCAKLESRIDSCKVLGIIDISVMICGSIFLGETVEPVNSVSNPYKNLDVGIAFTKRPKALIFDYHATVANTGVLVTAKGLGVKKTQGVDYPMAFVFLQNRKEMPDGTIVATRVGTAKTFFTNSSTNWENNSRLEIHYGDITSEKFYKSYMDLTKTYYAKNSKGKLVTVTETAWAAKNAPVTHAIVFFSSGYHEAFVGAIGNVLKVDNVKFEY